MPSRPCARSSATCRPRWSPATSPASGFSTCAPAGLPVLHKPVKADALRALLHRPCQGCVWKLGLAEAKASRRWSRSSESRADRRVRRCGRIGSGYGGAVAACRLAEAGYRVCVLERGEEYLPGEFPNDLSNLAAPYPPPARRSRRRDRVARAAFSTSACMAPSPRWSAARWAARARSTPTSRSRPTPLHSRATGPRRSRTASTLRTTAR